MGPGAELQDGDAGVWLGLLLCGMVRHGLQAWFCSSSLGTTNEGVQHVKLAR